MYLHELAILFMDCRPERSERSRESLRHTYRLRAFQCERARAWAEVPECCIEACSILGMFRFAQHDNLWEGSAKCWCNRECNHSTDNELRAKCCESFAGRNESLAIRFAIHKCLEYAKRYIEKFLIKFAL